MPSSLYLNHGNLCDPPIHGFLSKWAINHVSKGCFYRYVREIGPPGGGQRRTCTVTLPSGRWLRSWEGLRVTTFLKIELSLYNIIQQSIFTISFASTYNTDVKKKRKYTYLKKKENIHICMFYSEDNVPRT